MIKLIASDLDGTLVPEGTPDINPEVFEVIRKLKEKGILFAAASGRQYQSMYKLLDPIQNDVIFIAENGGYVVCRDRDIDCCSFEKPLFEEIIRYLRKMNRGYILVNAPKTAYMDCRDQAFVDQMRRGYKLRLDQIEDVLQVTEPVVKVALYCGDDAAAVAEPAKKFFQGRVHVMAAGKNWVDFVKEGVDKGAALRKVQQFMHITKEETMAFGDNHNDLGMLGCAGESYAVANAREEVKKAAKYVTDSNLQDGVLKVLRTLL
ncbi:MAG: HAD family hydrolase [Lachnospiraceae bacterium]|nr:HAD family hydrolase [Lachnospiraceae bacterium]